MYTGMIVANSRDRNSEMGGEPLRFRLGCGSVIKGLDQVVAVCCSMLQRVAVVCSVLQCVAVCYSVVQGPAAALS